LTVRAAALAGQLQPAPFAFPKGFLFLGNRDRRCLLSNWIGPRRARDVAGTGRKYRRRPKVGNASRECCARGLLLRTMSAHRNKKTV